MANSNDNSDDVEIITNYDSRNDVIHDKLGNDSVSHNCIPIVVINLARRQDKLISWSQAHTESLAKNEELAEIFGGNVWRLTATENKYDPSKGCLDSHRRAVQLAQDNGWPSVLVMEDDARWCLPPNVSYCKNTSLEHRLVEQLPTMSTYANGAAFVVFLGTTGAKNVKPISNHLLGSCSSSNRMGYQSNAIITSSHAILYVAEYISSLSNDNNSYKYSYSQILETLESGLKEDSWMSHVDLLLCTHLGSRNAVFVTVPFICEFADEQISDVRVGKSTKCDLPKLHFANKEYCDKMHQLGAKCYDY